MAKKRSLTHEAAASFVLAWLAIFMWHVVLPWFGFLERFLLRPGPWGELLGVLFISGTYYGVLCIVMFFADRIDAAIHPIPTAYLGGWWLAVILAALSVFSPSFTNILGLKVTTSGANLIFITLLVGTMKYWIDGYLHPPPPPTESDLEPQQEGFDDRSA
ncbi:MAG: hypothetical protein GX162_11000 [Firmicutes bacterium]|nr:hypothetical protein [Bacillota bacterium]